MLWCLNSLVAFKMTNFSLSFIRHLFRQFLFYFNSSVLTVEGVELFLRSLEITGLGGTLVELLEPFLPESSTPCLFSPWGLFEYEPAG